MIYNKIEELRKARKLSKTDFYAMIEMSGTGFRQGIENESLPYKKLKKIAQILSVPLYSLFMDSGKIVEEDMDGELLKIRLEHLELENANLKKEIEVRQKMYELLKTKVNG